MGMKKVAKSAGMPMVNCSQANRKGSKDMSMMRGGEKKNAGRTM